MHTCEEAQIRLTLWMPGGGCGEGVNKNDVNERYFPLGSTRREYSQLVKVCVEMVDSKV